MVTGFNGVTYTLVVDPFAIVAGTAGVLPNGTSGVAYNRTLTTNPAGCGSTCTWSVVGNTLLPTGFTLSPTGVLSGTSGPYNASFTVQATGSAGTVQKVVSLRIVNSTPQSLTISLGATFGDSSIGSAPAAALSASGGTLPYTWTLDAGSAPLPPGVTIQGPGETLSATTGPGFMYLAGRAMQAGVYTFTLAVTDAAATKVTKQITWRISELSYQYGTLPLAGNPLVVNTPYTQPLLFVGGSGSYTFTALNAMPPGLTLNSATGVVSGTPTAAGSFLVTVQVVDTTSKPLTQNILFNVSP